MMNANTEKTILTYCGDIRERLMACRTRVIAVALKERLCAELQINCLSSMVNNVMRKHVDQMIDEIFDETGKNRFLEV